MNAKEATAETTRKRGTMSEYNETTSEQRGSVLISTDPYRPYGRPNKRRPDGDVPVNDVIAKNVLITNTMKGKS